MIVGIGAMPIMPALSATQDPPLVRAPGGPLVDCTSATLARLESGMGPQREALRRTEEQFRQALAGNIKASAATQDAALDALRKLAEGQLKMAKMVRELKLLGVPQEQRRRVIAWTERLRKTAEQFEKLKTGAERREAEAELFKALKNNTADLAAFANFLQDSGISDDQLGNLANVLVPGIGQAAVDAAAVMRDLALAGLAEKVSDEEVARMREALDAMKYAVGRNEERIYNLRAMMAETCPKTTPKPQDSPKPIPPREPAPQPVPVKTAKKGGLSPGARIAIIGGMAAAGGTAAAVLGSRSGDNPGSGGSGGGRPTIVDTHAPWVCSGNRCTGQLTIDFPVVMSSGTITIGTESLFLGQRSVNPTTAPGRVTFDMEKSPYLTCYPTQTTVAIWNSAFTNTGPAAYTLSTSIPISCR